MTVTQAIASVLATGFTKICENDGTVARRSYKITNRGSASVYIGTAFVTSSVYGDVLAAGGWLIVELEAGEALYGVSASGTVSVSVLGLGTR